jgi:hypothetical protein
MNVAYQCIIHFLTFHHVTMDVGDHNPGALHIAPQLGNDSAGHDVVTNVGSGPMRAPRWGRGRFSRCTTIKC